MIGLDVEGQVVVLAIVAIDVRQVLVHLCLVVVVTEEAPHAGIGIAHLREGDRAIGIAEAEVLVLTTEVAFLTGEGDDVLGVKAVLRVLEGELADAGEVGMGRDAIVWDADCHPHGTLHAWALAHDLEDPRLVLVAHGDGLTRAVVAILLQEVCHDDDGIARCSSTLKAEVDHGIIIEPAFGVLQLEAPVEGGLYDADLLLIDVANDVVGVFHLWDVATDGSPAPLADSDLLSCLMTPARGAIHGACKAVAVAVVSTDHGAIDRGCLAYDEVGACL